MLKRDELANPNSCLNKAKDDEPIFVLLGRDIAAPYAVRVWIQQRMQHGKNQPEDAQLTEATDLADSMDLFRDTFRK